MSIGVEQSSLSSRKAESFVEMVDPRGEGDTNDDSHFSIRSRSDSASSLFEESLCNGVGVLSVSFALKRGEESPWMGDKGTLHPVWVLCFDLSSACS